MQINTDNLSDPSVILKCGGIEFEARIDSFGVTVMASKNDKLLMSDFKSFKEMQVQDKNQEDLFTKTKLESDDSNN